MQRQEMGIQEDVGRPNPIQKEIGQSAVPSHTSDPDFGRAHSGMQDALPADVLAEIFVLTLLGDSVHLMHHPSDMPWTLLQVCSQWRQVALGEYRLWNSLVANVSTNAMKSWLRTLWPPHSNSLASLEIRGSHRALDIYDVLFQHSSRLRVLSIARFDNVVSDFVDHMPLAFEHLEEVFLGWAQLSPGVSAALFSNVPKLRNISIMGVDSFPTTGSGFPWSQLTGLTLSGGTSSHEEIHLILRQCPILVQFAVVIGRASQVDYVAIPSRSDIVLRSLRELAITMFPGAILDGLFPRLVMPSLKTLVFAHKHIPPHPVLVFRFPQQEVVDMLAKSPAIEHLNVGCRFLNLDPIALVKKTPTLTTLIVQRSRVSSNIFNMIRNGEVLPNLSRMECSTLNPHRILDLLQHQYSSIGLHEYHGLTAIRIMYQKVNDSNDLRRRIQELDTQLRNIGDGKVLELKEVGCDGRVVMILERS